MNRAYSINSLSRISALQRRLVSQPLGCCLAAALVPRLLNALLLRNYYAPDEIFQYLEQAHRLVYHQGFVPWEFQVGLRSWLIPLALALPMEIMRWFSASPVPGLVLIRVLCCFASLSVVWCAVRWGQIYQGNRGACLAGMLAAFWPDLWLMAPHPMEEAFAAYTLLPAIHLAVLNKRAPDARTVLAAGFLLGLTFSLREQLAPAIAIAGIYLCGSSPKNWWRGIGMAMLPVLAVGLLDWWSWGEMFRSFWMNFYLNIVVGIASHFFDSESPVYFPLNLLYGWLWGAVFLVWLAWRGARQMQIAGWVALAILVEHSLIVHKELRYVFPGIALAVPLAGIGLASLWRPGSGRRNGLILAALLSGPYMSPTFYMMLRWQESAYDLYAQIAAQHPCEVAIGTWDRGFLPIMPLFGGITQFTDATGVAYADAIVARPGDARIPAGFTLEACAVDSWIPFHTHKPDICYWRQLAEFCQPARAAPFTLVYPPAARAFVIPDKLAPGP
jgi:GPI mannosyltransferase 3